MAKAYIGADNVAKLVKAMYMGVDGVARKVTKAYRGVDGVAKLVYSGEREYLYGGTSTFVHTGSFTPPEGADYTLTTDEFTLQIEKFDETPLNVYFDGELVATSTTSGVQAITIDGGASTLNSKGTITVTITSESTYSLGEQDFYQIWDYTGTEKGSDDKTVRGSITSAKLSDNIVSINDFAFDSGAFTSIIIPDSVTSIGKSAFRMCGSLTSIIIPDSVTSIGESAFYFCGSLTSIIIPDCVTSIGESAFQNCAGLTSIIIPDSVTSIGYSTFYGCRNLVSITIPNGVTSIGESAFINCPLTTIRFKHGATDTLSITISDDPTSYPLKSAFYIDSNTPTPTTVYHNGNASVLNYDWASCNRTVTFIQE